MNNLNKTLTIKVQSVEAFHLINCLQNELVVIHADKQWIRIEATQKHLNMLAKANIFWVHA